MNSLSESMCRLCNGLLAPRFKLKVLDQYDVTYFECQNCRSLQTETPYWLDEAYKYNLSNLDTGAVQRNISNFAYCLAFSKIFNVRTAVDYGSSDGLLCRFMRDYEIDCYAYDKYTKPVYAQDFATPPKANIDLLTAFEVLEHLPNPSKDLEEIFSFHPKFFFCSTELYTNQDANWWYLGPDSGQHIFFYSIPAMHLIAQKYQYNVTQVGEKFLFYKSDLSNVQNMVVAAQTALSGWIFQAIKSYVFLLPPSGIGKDMELLKRKSLIK